MQVELHNNLKNPLVLPATRLLVVDDFGNPVAFAVQLAPGHVRTGHVGEADFNEQLQMHGFDVSVIVSRIDPEKLAKRTILKG